MKRLLVLAVVLVVAAAGALRWWGRSSLPPLDGERPVPGLAAPVEVLFDSHGVPHVYAAGSEDAWLAAGVMHARDRLWQMELYRRAAYGRLSEVFGQETLPVDRRLATLDLRRAAETEWRHAPGEAQRALERYAAGVNAMAGRLAGRRLPIEFQLLGIRPAPWSPIDSLAVGRLLSWRLAENHQSELVRHALAAAFGAAEAVRLGGQYPVEAPTIIQGPRSETGGLRPMPAPASRVDAEPVAHTFSRAAASWSADGSRGREGADDWPRGLEWLRPGARRGNSNNWVVSGQRTATGRPLLANDPHLQLEFPGIWYEMHLVAAGLDVIGVTLPGTPFVILGHNARLAWGMTNSGADVQDLFVERIELARRRYFYRGDWFPVEIMAIEIPVRGADPHPFEIWRTRHGTVFADVGLDWDDAPDFLSPRRPRTGERRVFTLRWDSLSGETAGPFEALNRATGWTEFTTALERFAAPSQNVVYADVDGNVGYALTGTLPRRGSGAGILPADGTSGDGEWVGSVDGAELPRVLNPESGYITSSNNQVDRHWPGLLTRDWAAPYRTTRLHALIGSAERVDLEAAARWQNDVAGLGPAHVLSIVEGPLRAAERQQGEARSPVDEAALDVLRQLHEWDRQLDGRPVVTLYHLFEEALWRRTFYDEMGAPLFERFYEWAASERPAGLTVVLDEPHSRWFDDIGTIERRETRDDVVRLAAADAAERFARESDRRPWSEAHAARFDHPLGAGAAPLAWLFNRGPIPVHGGTTTVMRISHNRLRPFAAWEIPSWRQLFDVGDWDSALVVLPGGQSGHPLSPHYFDQNELWQRGEYRQQPFSRAAVEAARQHRLVLVPE